MNEDINLDEIIQDPEQWPKCPSCDGSDILFGGTHAICVNCSFNGIAKDVANTKLARYSRVKLSQRQQGQRGVMLMGRNDQTPEFERKVAARSSELAQRLIHEGHYLKAKQVYEEEGELMPAFFVNRSPEDGNTESFPIDDDREGKFQLRYKALNQDVVSVIWAINQPDAIDAIALPGETQAWLAIETHIYNAPSHVRAIRVNTAKNNEKVFGQELPLFNDIVVEPLIYQPIYWPIIFSKHGSIQPRYVAALELEKEININLAVCDNMDGAPFILAAERKPWSIEKAKIKKYSFDSAEEGIEVFRAKYKEALEIVNQSESSKLIFAQELEWGLEEDPTLIMYQLRNAELWQKFAEHRNNK